MKTHKLLIPIIALAVLGSSCSKDSKPALSSAQAEQAISDVNANLANDLGDLQTSKGGVALTSFTDLTSTTSPFGRLKSFNKPGEITAAMSAGLISVRQMLNRGTGGEKIQGSNEPFNFEAKKVYKYVYNFNTKMFDAISDPSSTIIKIQYPKDSTSVTNDAELQITKYTDVLTSDGYNPLEVNAAIYINSVKEVSLTLSVTAYDDNAEPTKASEELYVNPFTFSFSFDKTPSTSATESLSLSRSGATLIGVGATAVWASAADKTNGAAPRNLTGYFQLKTLRFSVSVDGSKANTATSNNDFIVITVTSNGSLAGHVVWAVDPNNPNDGEQPYMQYNDGNKVLLSTVFDQLGTQIDALING